MKDPTRHVYSRDLDVVLEENNIHQGKSYLDQVLEPNSLGFLRNGKATSSSGNNINNDSFTPTTSCNTGHLHTTSLPQRRARAGTMPSMMSFDSLHLQQQSPLLRTATHNHAAAAGLNHQQQQQQQQQQHHNHTLTTSTSSSTITPRQLPPPPPPAPVGGGRHRSGSLNLPPPSLSFDTSSSLFWSTNASLSNTPTPPSPATEQLLQGDSDFSIARTMRSLGLAEDGSSSATSNSNIGDDGIAATAVTSAISSAVAPIQAVLDEEELINQSRASLLASASNTTTRNRSYSVNATVRYDPPAPPQQHHLHSSLAYLHPQQQHHHQQQHHFTLRPRGNTVSKTSFNTPPNSLSSFNHYHHLLDTFAPGGLPPPPPPLSSSSSSSALPLSSSSQPQQQRTRSISFGQSSSSSPPPPPPSSSFPGGLTRPQLMHHHHHHHGTFGGSSSSISDSTSSSASSNSSLWQMHRPLTPVIGEEEHMSLGDSELLANMYEPTTTTTIPKQQQPQPQPQPQQEEPASTDSYMHLSHSTPTSMRFATATTATRSLWIGNIDASITVDLLTQTFAPYGPIESVRLLMEKECAFVNYFYVDHAVRAKEDLLGPLGGRIGHCVVRIGYGRTDATNEPTTTPSPPPQAASPPPQQDQQVTHQATRALWLGNIPADTTSTLLEKIFANYGKIESIRILSHKTCAFINFDTPASASAAQDAFHHQMDLPDGFDTVRIGFAKVPPPQPTSPPNSKKKQSPSPSLSSSTVTNTNNTTTTTTTTRRPSESPQDRLDELWACMVSLGCSPKEKSLLQDLGTSSTMTYADAIPPVPEFSNNRLIDANRLRDIRKKLDGTTQKSVCDTYATECMGEIAELCSDYIGNTVLQRFFDKCSEPMKLTMLERIAPHLAAIGIHKNGTWAAQKILDTLKTPQQCALVRKYVKTYVPALLLDQFGNYVVQCCLRLDGENQFVFDAMVENCGVISQGRFGARAMRGILESQYTSPSQQAMMAACLIQHAASLVTHANGSLLVAWLMDTYTPTSPPVVLRGLAVQLIPHISSLAVHKLGSQVLLKLINQTVDKEAQEIVLSRLVTDATLTALLLHSDTQPRSWHFFQKVLYSPHLSQAERHVLGARARAILIADPHPPTAFLDELNGLIKDGC
ncbi:hypothetical protein [Absidia glauca]|uniref:PUM-HD domain-containing protein n=1 Tax=Absidia glauca TaxID=4829 RepID=A0A168MIG0_ABSGL|nr:hypothetical protein [Absidia glauca]